MFQDRILKKSYRLLGLAILILILGLIFFFWRGQKIYSEKNSTHGQYRILPLTSGFTQSKPDDEWLRKSNLSSLEKFRFFEYPLNQKNNRLIIETTCADDFYAVLIFSQGDDYRHRSSAAKYNKAFPCQINEEIKHEINLAELNLPPGKYYYFVADQGKEGGWYNPR